MEFCGVNYGSSCCDAPDENIYQQEDYNEDVCINPASIDKRGVPVATMKVVKHKGDVSSVAISNDKKFFVLSSEDNTASVWDSKTGEEIFTLRGHTDDIRSVKIAPDDSYIITVSNDTTAIMWDMETGKRLNTYGVGEFVLIIMIFVS